MRGEFLRQREEIFMVARKEYLRIRPQRNYIYNQYKEYSLEYKKKKGRESLKPDHEWPM